MVEDVVKKGITPNSFFSIRDYRLSSGYTFHKPFVAFNIPLYFVSIPVDNSLRQGVPDYINLIE